MSTSQPAVGSTKIGVNMQVLPSHRVERRSRSLSPEMPSINTFEFRIAASSHDMSGSVFLSCTSNVWRTYVNVATTGTGLPSLPMNFQCFRNKKTLLSSYEGSSELIQDVFTWFGERRHDDHPHLIIFLCSGRIRARLSEPEAAR